VRRTALEASKTRAALLDAALFAFAENGVGNTRLADIATRAGLTRGALYHHFHDKETLFSAVLEECWTAVATPVWSELGDDAHSLDHVEAFLTVWINHLRQDERFRALLTILVNTPISPNSEEHLALAQALSGIKDRLATVLESCRAEAPASFDPDAVARHLVAWLCGTSVIAAAALDLLPLDGRSALEGLLPSA
jgi:TetR/AcrR family acrAB operon transcriptional repressor